MVERVLACHPSQPPPIVDDTGVGVTRQGHPANWLQSLFRTRGGGSTAVLLPQEAHPLSPWSPGAPAGSLSLTCAPHPWEGLPGGRCPLTAPVLFPTGSGQQGEETLHCRLSGDRKVPTGACNLRGCLPSQQPLGIG